MVEVDSVGEDMRDSRLKPGMLVADKYRIQSMLGEGAMGRVYAAVQEPIRRKVALKVLQSNLSDDSVALQRFFREAVAASKIQHPHAITIIDYGEMESGVFFLVTEFADGETLGHLIDHTPRFPVVRALNIVAQIAEALAIAHDHGVLHRDIKPENIMVTQVDRADWVKVLDFGLAKIEGEGGSKLTFDGAVCGTPAYMAPEQAMGQAIDGRADLYALGIILFEMLEGKLPFSGGNVFQLAYEHQTADLPDMSKRVPPSVQQFIRTATAKKPDDRHDDARVFLHALKRAAERANIDLHIRAREPTAELPANAPAPHKGTTTEMPASLLATVPDAQPPSAPQTARSTDRSNTRWLLAAAVMVLLCGTIIVGITAVELLPTTSATGPSTTVTDAPHLYVTARPGPAEVWRDGELLGMTPLVVVHDGNPTARLRLTREGFEDVLVEPTFPMTGSLDVAVHLRPHKKVVFEVTSDPPGAGVFINEDEVGVTPWSTKLERDDATVEIELRLPGKQPAVVALDPTGGGRRLHVELATSNESEEGRSPDPRQEVGVRAPANPPARPNDNVVKRPTVKTPPVKKTPNTDSTYEMVD